MRNANSFVAAGSYNSLKGYHVIEKSSQSTLFVPEEQRAISNASGYKAVYFKISPLKSNAGGDYQVKFLADGAAGSIFIGGASVDPNGAFGWLRAFEKFRNNIEKRQNPLKF